nr:hypothetical protein [Tanacetum cinerariifolium]
EDFTKVPDDESTLTFLIDLGSKVHYTNPEKGLRKRVYDNEDPSAGPNQGKKTIEVEPNILSHQRNHPPPKNHLKSATKVRYDKDAKKGIKHWGDKRQLWYRSQINKISKHKVYSTQKILNVVSVKVKRLHGYDHLDEIVVRRANQQLYKFKEEYSAAMVRRPGRPFKGRGSGSRIVKIGGALVVIGSVGIGVVVYSSAGSGSRIVEIGRALVVIGSVGIGVVVYSSAGDMVETDGGCRIVVVN